MTKTRTEKNLDQYQYQDEMGFNQNKRINFYVFWLAQYTARNPEFRKEVQEIKDLEFEMKKITGSNIGTIQAIEKMERELGVYKENWLDIENLQEIEEQLDNDNDLILAEYMLYKNAIKSRKKDLYLQSKFFFSSNICSDIESPDRLLESIINGEEIKKDGITESFPVVQLLPLNLYAVRRHENGNKELSYGNIHEKNSGDILLSINFDSSLEGIIQGIISIKESLDLREKIIEEHAWEWKNNEFEEIKGSSQEILKRLNSYDPQINEILGAYIASNENISYQNDDEKRILGLWIWDYCQQNKCGSTTAIKELESRFNLGEQGIKVDPKTLQRYHKRTEKCIEKPEVLTMRR